MSVCLLLAYSTLSQVVMRLSCRQSQCLDGFTLVEVLIAVSVAVIFGAAAFETNERLLIMLKSQRETTAASMMLQERMESFRSLSYSGLSSYTTSGSTTPPATAADVVANATISEGQLGGGITGSLSETVTISGYMDTSGNCPPTTAGSTQWVRSAAYSTGNLISSTANMVSNYDLIQVDIQLSWTGATGRARKREMTAIFGKGNKGS